MNTLSRRDVLALAGASLTLPSFASLTPRQTVGGEIVFFSDTHVMEARNIDENRAMMERIKTLTQAELAINGGDVTEYGWEVDYRAYGTLLQEFGIPTHHVPGNHDVRWAPLGGKIFRDRLGDAYQALRWQDCHLLLLDSTVPLSHWGHFSRAQLRWLERRLQAIGKSDPVVLTMHHWVGRDQVVIDNEEELLTVIEPYNIKLILTGHGHSDLFWNWDGIPCLMNRGLYQGSWTRLLLPERERSLVVERYRKEQDQLEVVATLPLARSSQGKPIWAQSGLVLSPGQPLKRDFPEATEGRWNRGVWQPLSTIQQETPTIQGLHRLTVRGNDRIASGFVTVRNESSPLRQIWNAPLPGEVMSHLVSQQGDIFVSTFSGHVLRIEPGRGIARWQTQLEGVCHGTPTIIGDRLIQTTLDGHIVCLALNSGKILWAKQFLAPIPMSPTVVQDTVVFCAGDGKFYGLDLISGQNKWTADMPASKTAFAQSRAATDGNLAFIGAWDSHLYALDPASGRTVWRQACMDRTFAFSPAIGGPAVAKNRVVVPANGNGLFCFDTSSGNKLWEVTAEEDKYGHSSPLILGDSIYVGCLGDKGQVRKVRLQDGKEEWVAETGSVIYDSSPTAGPGFIAIGSVANLLSVMDQSKGRILAQVSLPPGHFLSSPLALGNRLFAATFNSRLIGWEWRP
ncbi:MAG: PQQ-binding-like beta-propeller repeat protein [Fimbriimonadaceae bacterium]|jgi:outer membrane protein assembly factor BamB|nr:PQQ-binding-like beta-propeller repeat protein [Fimbriimonadaceae bacterium]